MRKRLHDPDTRSAARQRPAALASMAVWYKGLSLLGGREKRFACLVIGMMLLAALSATMMVAAIFPFLLLISDPASIDKNRYFQIAYRYFEFAGPYHFLVAVGSFSACVIILSNVLQILHLWIGTYFTAMVGHRLSSRILETYLRQPYEFFLNRHSGDMSKTVLSEAERYVANFLNPVGDLMAATLTVIFVLAFMCFVQPYVTIASVALIGGLYGGTYLASRAYIGRKGKEHLAANGKRFTVAAEALGGIKEIRVLGHEAHYLKGFRKWSALVARSMVSVRIAAQLPRYVLQAIAFGGIIVLCLVIIDRQAFESGSGLNEIVPVLGMFAVAGQRLLPEFQRAFAAAMQLRYGAAGVESLYADFERRTVALPPQADPGRLRLQRRLRLDAISYRYPGSPQPEISDVTLTIDAGERIGIVGHTGAGKTTLVDVILGLLSPQKGRILVDEVEISETNRRACQQTIGYVPQDIFLTDASVAENIALGVSQGEIDQQRVRHAAHMAQIDAFIMRQLEDGYATKVGERGVRLSGGQVQRIGIARALYHDPELVIFDEATSALDTLTEREVMNAIDALSAKKTVILIAHRLSTLRCCDRVVVMEAGRVVGFDNWPTLEKGNATFQRLLAA